MTDAALLQAVKLKGGLANAALLAAATGLDEAAVAPAIDAALADGLVAEKGGRYRITSAGREALDTDLGREREGLDPGRVEEVYKRFVPLNAEFKEVVGAWQMRDGAPNAHDDAAYDAEIIARLDELHERMDAVAADAGDAIPRLGPYRGRFAAALREVKGGDQRYLASPVVDSYHQVWFEFHEELIGVAGRVRLEEAKEGRA